MDLCVGLIGKLPGPDGVVGLLHHSFGAFDRAAHALSTGSQHDLCAVGAQHDLALSGHRLGHREHHPVAAGGTDHGQGDAGVAGGALHNGSAGLEDPGLLCGIDDGPADPVLH